MKKIKITEEKLNDTIHQLIKKHLNENVAQEGSAKYKALQELEKAIHNLMEIKRFMRHPDAEKFAQGLSQYFSDLEQGTMLGRRWIIDRMDSPVPMGYSPDDYKGKVPIIKKSLNESSLPTSSEAKFAAEHFPQFARHIMKDPMVRRLVEKYGFDGMDDIEVGDYLVSIKIRKNPNNGMYQ